MPRVRRKTSSSTSEMVPPPAPNDKAIKLSETLLEIVGKMYGEQAKTLLKYIIDTGGAPEETIGRDIGVKSNEARKILQKLGSEAIVTCRGKKTGDKVLHYWYINWHQIEGILINRLKKTHEKLATVLNYVENNIIYECTVCGRIYELDKVVENDYTCPMDGGELREVNKEEIVSKLRSKMAEIDLYLRKIQVSKT